MYYKVYFLCDYKNSKDDNMPTCLRFILADHPHYDMI